jgi:hypothetical protein
MRLAEILAARPVTAAGVLITVTRRCPLHCAHCSTGSTMAGSHPDAGPLRRFVHSFTPTCRPDIALFTGGEPLLRPHLVAELAAAAAAAGTRTAVLTGAFFARQAAIPAPVLRVADTVDHLSVSIDAQHEAEVPRQDVFRLLRRLLERGTAVSLHIVGSGPEDAYLAEVTGEVQRVFGAAVPMLVGEISPTGRAATWAARSRVSAGSGSAPCPLAAWPVVAFDGAVTACCNQDVVDGVARPAHLLLGSVGTDGWPQVRERALASPVLRVVRALGPPGGSCAGCQRWADQQQELRRAEDAGSGAVGALLDWEATRRQVAAGPVAMVRRYGCAPYAPLVGTGDGTGP